MTGLEALQTVRLAALPVHRLTIEIDSTASPGTWQAGGFTESVLIVEKMDSAPRCDLRMARGLDVTIFAPSYARGWPFADAVIEHQPASLTLHAADMAAHWTPDGGLRAWDL
jgi:hypothetical protein